MPDKVTYVNPEGACEAQGLYSHLTAVPAGTDLLFVAGQLAVGEHGEVVGIGDFRVQFAQVHKNLGAVLTGMGVGWDDVIQFRTYLVHSQDIPTFMELRAELFPTLFSTSEFPPNTLLTVDRLVKEDFLFELEAVVAGRSAGR
jgi:enamine deaminase RidA (YjgF/YER057c/UK114 family)